MKNKTWQLIDNMVWGQFTADGGPGSGNFGHAGRPGEVGGSASEGSSSKEPEYHGKVGTIKYRDLEFEMDKTGKITSGPKALIEGLKHPKSPGEGIKQGDLVIYAPKWREPGEEKYIHVVLEERGPKILVGTLNTRLALGSTESFPREYFQSIGYNAGVAENWKKHNDPDTKDADPKAEKEQVRKSYLRKLDEYVKGYRDAQNRADESKMHYYDERIKEVQKKLKELGS